MASNAAAYFGVETVARAVAFYFATHGVTEKVRDELIAMEVMNGDAFFQMVSDFIETEDMLC